MVNPLCVKAACLRTVTLHYATLTVAWLLRGATATPAATLVGVSAEWAAIADSAAAEGEAARQVERAWQRAQATAALTVPVDAGIVAGIWGRGEEGRSNG